jgi:archaellum component FlaC
VEQAVKYAIESGAGIFAVLFIILLGWVLRTNDQRENRYLNVIDKYGDKIDDRVTVIDGKVDNLQKDVAGLKTDVGAIKTDVSRIMGVK